MLALYTLWRYELLDLIEVSISNTILYTSPIPYRVRQIPGHIIPTSDTCSYLWFLDWVYWGIREERSDWQDFKRIQTLLGSIRGSNYLLFWFFITWPLFIYCSGDSRSLKYHLCSTAQKSEIAQLKGWLGRDRLISWYQGKVITTDYLSIFIGRGVNVMVKCSHLLNAWWQLQVLRRTSLCIEVHLTVPTSGFLWEPLHTVRNIENFVVVLIIAEQ